MTRAMTTLIGLALPLLATAASALTLTTVRAGDWNDPGTWGHEWAYPQWGDHAVCLHAVNVTGSEGCDSLTVAAGGMVHTNYGYRELQIQSHARIDGTVFSEEGGWPLTVRLLGDLELNGDIICHDWRFTGLSGQRLAMGPDARLAPRQAHLRADGRIEADTDLRFATDLDLQGGTLALGGEHDAVFGGGFVDNAVIEADGATVRFTAGAYLGDSSLRAPVLAGCARIYGDVSCTGITTVQDTVISHYGHAEFMVETIVNQGLIDDGDWSIDVRVTGDLANHGVWRGHELIIAGTGAPQTMTQAPGSPYEPDYLNVSTGTGPITIEGAVEVASTVDAGDAVVSLEAGAALVLAGGTLQHAVIEAAGGVLECRDGAWFQSAVVADAVLRGDALVGNGTVLTGTTVIDDALDGRPNVTISLEDVDNAGAVGLASGAFTLTVTGDLNNRGAWEVARVTIDGVVDQFVGASDAHPVGEVLRLDANLGGTGHVWSRDGVVKPGLTGVTLDLEPATSAHHGAWQCHSSAGDSRLITIGAPQPPTAVGDVPDPPTALSSYPNPFNPRTTIVFTLAWPGPTRLEVFDPRGRRVARLVDGWCAAGRQMVSWDATGEAAGVYLYRLQSGGDARVGRGVLIR